LASVVFENDGSSQQFTGVSAGGDIFIDRKAGIGPSSGEYLLFSLGSCVIGMLRNYLVAKDVEIDGLRVELVSEVDEETKAYEKIHIVIKSGSPLSDKLRAVFLNVAKTCRIHRTLEGGPEMSVEIMEMESAQPSAAPGE